MADSPPPSPRFTRGAAALLVSRGEFGPARAMFDAIAVRLAAATAARFEGFSRALLTRNKENYGLYFVHDRARVPFLWLGMAWRADDEAGTLPSWGASLEVDGAEVAPFLENRGGLFAACQAVDARHDGQVQLHRFPRHLELARWRPFDWLLDEPDQDAAIEAFWDGYLETLSLGGLSPAVAAFIADRENA